MEGISATGHGSAAGNSYTIVFDIRIGAIFLVIPSRIAARVLTTSTDVVVEEGKRWSLHRWNNKTSKYSFLSCKHTIILSLPIKDSRPNQGLLYISLG